MELKLPLEEKAVRSLKLGDIVYLNGEFYTARDEAHIHALSDYEKGKKPPVDFKGSAIFHCGPIVRKAREKWELVAAGPTTSSRMNALEPRFIEIFRPSAIIGKGGMSRPTVEAMQRYGCVYLAITGGAAVLAARGVKEVKGVHWLELGMPEALWILEAEHFGPLIVAIDSYGNSLYEKVNKAVELNLPKVREKLGLK
ncbi:MAG: FumA C-terminus/TtdB family hydratase beta subunit [Halobacteria archaeon]